MTAMFYEWHPWIITHLSSSSPLKTTMTVHFTSLAPPLRARVHIPTQPLLWKNSTEGDDHSSRFKIAGTLEQGEELCFTALSVLFCVACKHNAHSFSHETHVCQWGGADFNDEWLSIIWRSYSVEHWGNIWCLFLFFYHSRKTIKSERVTSHDGPPVWKLTRPPATAGG